jgi:hypothetical protein
MNVSFGPGPGGHAQAQVGFQQLQLQETRAGERGSPAGLNQKPSGCLTVTSQSLLIPPGSLSIILICLNHIS